MKDIYSEAGWVFISEKQALRNCIHKGVIIIIFIVKTVNWKVDYGRAYQTGFAIEMKF